MPARIVGEQRGRRANALDDRGMNTLRSWESLKGNCRQLPFVVVTLMLACVCTVLANGATCEPEKAVVVSGKVVVFFAPSQVEYDQLTEDSRSAATEALSDFLVYSQRLGKYLDNKGIPHITTSAEFIEIRRGEREALCIVRAQLGDQVGAVLSDGSNAPEVILGVVTDTEYLPLVDRYFQGKRDP